jgi:hypothetical protein
MKKIFYFPKFEWKYILFLLFFIFSFLQTSIIRWISMNSKDVAQPFLNTYLFSVSDFLAIIPYLIVFLRSRRIKGEEIRLAKINSIKGSFLYNKGDKKSKNFYWLNILVALFDFGSHISSLLFYIVYGRNERSISENNLSSLLIFNTVIIYVLSRFVLKTYFYKHHYFSFLINVICILTLGTIDIINIINTDDKDKGSTGMVIFYIIKKILSIVFYAVEDVIGKKLLMEEFISIYTLLLYRAIFGTIFMIIFSIPFIFVKVTDTSNPNNPVTEIIFNRILKLFEDLNAYRIILFTITNLFYNIFIWLIIDKFSPSHYSISIILESFGTLIRLWITEPEKTDLPVLRMFIFFILIFASFIHTELIVINYCDLQKNTKLFLDEIEKSEFKNIDDIKNGRNSRGQSINMVELEQSFTSSDYDNDDSREFIKEDNNESRESN